MPKKRDPNITRRTCTNCGKDFDDSHICKADERFQRDREIVAYMMALVHARSKGDYLSSKIICK